MHDTGVFVFAQVQTIENRVGRALCPRRLLRQLRSWLPLNPQPQPQPKENCHDPPIHVPDAAPCSPTPSSAAYPPSALTLGAGVLAPFLNLPEALLRETGLFLIAYTALVGWLGTRPIGAEGAGAARGRRQRRLDARQHRAAVLGRGVSPNLLGEIVVVAQAIATGVFAELQYIGLRRSGGAVTA